MSWDGLGSTWLQVRSRSLGTRRLTTSFNQESSPGNGNVQFPLPAHVVVGNQALVAVFSAQRIRSLQPKPSRRPVDAVRELRVFGQRLLRHPVVGIEQQAIVDFVAAKRVHPTRNIHLDGRITHHQEIDHAQTVWKHVEGRGDGLRRFRGVEVIEAAGIQVLANQLVKLNGEQAGAVIPPKIRAVADDRVVSSRGMGDEPAAAVVDENMHLGILQKGTHLRVLRNQAQVARVDLDDVERFDLRMTGEDLPPGTRGKADHQHAPGSRVYGAQNQGAEDQVRVVTRIDPEVAIVHAASKDGSLLCHGNHAIAVLNDSSKWSVGVPVAPKGQLFVEGIKTRRRQRYRSQSRHAERTRPYRRKSGFSSRKKNSQSSRQHCQNSKLQRDLAEPIVLHQHETDEQAAQYGAEDVRHVDQAHSPARFFIRRNRKLA